VEPVVYPIRLTAPAIEDIEQAVTYLSESAGEIIAEEWQTGLFEVLRKIATFPRSNNLARENRYLSGEIRQIVYRRRPGAVAYRVLFTLVEKEDDPPFVRVLHIRHGARRPMTRSEAAERNRATDESL